MFGGVELVGISSSWGTIGTLISSPVFRPFQYPNTFRVASPSSAILKLEDFCVRDVSLESIMLHCPLSVYFYVCFSFPLKLSWTSEKNMSLLFWNSQQTSLASVSKNYLWSPVSLYSCLDSFDHSKLLVISFLFCVPIANPVTQVFSLSELNSLEDEAKSSQHHRPPESRCRGRTIPRAEFLEHKGK